MTDFPRALRACLIAVFAALAAYLLYISGEKLVRENLHHEEDRHIPEYANLVVGLRGERVAYVTANPRDIDPLDRDRIIHMAWEVSPGAVVPIGFDDVAAWRGPLVHSAGLTSASVRRYEKSGHEVMAYNEFAVLRSRIEIDAAPREESEVRTPTLRGFAGTAAAILVLGALWYLSRGRRLPSAGGAIGAAAVFVALCSVALRFGLTAPNGLAVYAGKAKLLLLAGGVPDGFWTSQDYAVYQPSYPFGMVLPALLAFFVGGGAETFCLQMFVPFVLSLVFLEISEGKNPLAFLLGAAYVLCPVAQRLAIGFYAEPLCALVLIMGWKQVRNGNALWGWGMIGAAGLVRHEGLILAAALLAVSSAANRRFDARALLLALLPGVAWQVFALSVGSHLQGYEFGALPSLERIAEAGYEAFRRLISGFELSGIIVLAGLLFAIRRKWRSMPTAFAAFALAAIVAVSMLGFCNSGEFSWIAQTVLGRYLWLAAAVPVCEACRAA